MASRLFIQGAKYGADMLYQITVGTWDFTPTQRQVDDYMNVLHTAIVIELERLDDRLWWQPETSEIFCEEDGSERELPDEIEFESWWDDMIDRTIGYVRIPSL